MPHLPMLHFIVLSPSVVG